VLRLDLVKSGIQAPVEAPESRQMAGQAGEDLPGDGLTHPLRQAVENATRGDAQSWPSSLAAACTLFHASSKENSNRWIAASRMNSFSGWASASPSRRRAFSKSASSRARRRRADSESFGMVERGGPKGFVGRGEIDDIEGAEGPNRFKIGADRLQNSAGNRSRPEDADVDIGLAVRRTGRFGGFARFQGFRRFDGFGIQRFGIRDSGFTPAARAATGARR
jgi:hypothetical protein